MLSVGVSRDGSNIVTGSADKTARIWNSADGKTIATTAGYTRGAISAVSISDDGSRIVTGSADQTVRVWTSPSGRELQRMSDHRAGVVGVAFLGNNKSVVSAGADNAVRAWMPAAVRIFAGHDGPILCAAV